VIGRSNNQCIDFRKTKVETQRTNYIYTCEIPKFRFFFSEDHRKDMSQSLRRKNICFHNYIITDSAVLEWQNVEVKSDRSHGRHSLHYLHYDSTERYRRYKTLPLGKMLRPWRSWTLVYAALITSTFIKFAVCTIVTFYLIYRIFNDILTRSRSSVDVILSYIRAVSKPSGVIGSWAQPISNLCYWVSQSRQSEQWVTKWSK
jgi:hypothetical protein